MTKGYHCPECEVYSSAPKEEHVCRGTKCFACGWIWRVSLSEDVRHTSWSDDCACTDDHPCVAHSWGMRPWPTRPPTPIIEARAQAHRKSRHEHWEQQRQYLKRAAKRVAALEEFYLAMRPWVGDGEWNDVIVDGETYFTPIREVSSGETKRLVAAIKAMRDPGMWSVTPDQFEELQRQFKDPILWLEDCNRYIGRPLTGSKAHWCRDWDGLPVDETTKEFECCSCWEGTDESQKVEKEDHQKENPSAAAPSKDASANDK